MKKNKSLGRLLTILIIVAVGLAIYRYAPRMSIPSITLGEETKPQETEEVSTPEAAPEVELFGPYEVVRVIDGDTAIINIDGTETKVRFIGVDTPESVNPDESKNTPEGKIASDYTKSLLSGKSVYLEYDVETTDDYGRTLAYIYMSDKETMVQKELLKAGLATTMTIQPNSKYANQFYAIQVEARENQKGFWETGFFGG